MKRLYLTIAILAAALAVTTGSPTAALANDDDHGGYRGKQGNNQHYGHGGRHGDKHGHRRHHKRQDHRRHRKHGKQGKHGKHYQHNGYGAVGELLYTLGNFGRHGSKRGYDYGGGSACHNVSKDGYAHGRNARIGGTMCYDRYGQGYVVPGSRYVIHYY